MGTRGIFGFRINDKDYLTYNNFDSYPSGLGESIRECVVGIINAGNIHYARDQVSEIILLEDNVEDSVIKDVQAEAKRLSLCDESVSTQSDTDPYCLLRRAQGNPLYWVRDGLKYMNDGSCFVNDSLFCEYGYIINFDTSKVEYYRGFQKSHHNHGRYAKNEGINGWYPIALIDEYDFEIFANMNMETLEELVRD